MTILLVYVYAVAGSHVPPLASTTSTIGLACMNLKGVMTTWIIQQYEHPKQRAFDIDAAKKDMRSGYSPWSEGRAARRWAVVTFLLWWAPVFVVSTIVYLLALSVLVGRRARCAVFAVVVALLSVFVGSLWPRQTAGRLFPGSYAFLSDAVLLPDIDLINSNPQQRRTIAAYDVNSFRQPGYRVIAFADGHVEWLWDDRAKPLFQAQGVPYPKQAD